MRASYDMLPAPGSDHGNGGLASVSAYSETTWLCNLRLKLRRVSTLSAHRATFDPVIRSKLVTSSDPRRRDGHLY